MQIKQVFNILLEIQKRLYFEYASSSYLDDAINEDVRQNFEDHFLQQIISDKQYYSRILSLVYYLNGKDPLFEKPSVLLLKHKQIPDQLKIITEMNIPEIFSIYDKQDETNLLSILVTLSNANALTFPLIDTLTYSIIPSLYSMFLESSTFNLFCELILKLKDYDDNGKINKIKTSRKDIPLHYYLSRSLFISPFFLKFFQKSIIHFLRPFYNNQLPKETSEAFIVNTQNKILQSFAKNLQFIPSNIKIFFQKVNDTKSYLTECLFEAMHENPELFLIINIPDTDYKDKIDLFKEALKLIFTENLIEQFSNMIDSTEKSFKSLFEYQKDQQKCYYKIIDSVDFHAFDKISKFISSENKNGIDIDLISQFKVTEYSIYKALFESEDITKRNNISKGTEIKFVDCWRHFRKLVKDGPLIPENLNYSKNEEKVTPENFLKMVKSLFVDSLDLFKMNEAQIAYNCFEEQLQEPENESIILSTEKFHSKIESLVTVHQKQDESIEIINRIRSHLCQLYPETKAIIILNKELYKTVITNKIQKNNGLKIPTRSIDFNQDPVKYRYLFDAYLNEQNTELGNIFGDCDECNQIWFHRYHYNLDFFSYCAYRHDLQKYDQVANNMFQRYKMSFDEIKEKKVKKAIPYLYLFQDSFSEIREAFESNGNPLEKFRRIHKATEYSLGLCTNKFDANDGDNRIIFHCVLFAFVDPPRFVSNLVFILEFVSNRRNPVIRADYFDLIQRVLMCIGNEINDDYFINNPFYCLSRCHRINLCVFITGTNSNSIVKLLKSFVLSVAGRKPDEKELDSYVDLINSKPKKKFSLSLKIANMKNDVFKFDFKLCASTVIYFGKDIQFTSNINTENKIGLYAYKQRENENFLKKLINNEASDFISTNLIENKNKLVVYEPDENIENLQLPESIERGSYKTVNPKMNTILSQFEYSF